MESISINLDSAALFDELLNQNRAAGLPENGDLMVITKRGATEGGRSAVMFTWTVTDGGKARRVQATTTLRTAVGALTILKAELEREEAALQLQ